VNSLVEVILDDARTYRSRMEDVADGLLTVAAPIGVGDVEPPQVGDVFELAWADRKARHLVSVRLAALTKERPCRWLVEVDGEARRDNRRNFMRAGGGGEQVRMARPEVEDAAPVLGRLIDVSEAGIRCWLASCDFTPGEFVQIQATLRDNSLGLVGQVLSVRQPGASGKGADLVVTYQVDEASAQVIRRYVMAYDLAERRLARDQAA